MPRNSAEPLVARILMAKAIVANPSQAINSHESKSKQGHATDRVDTSPGTSSKETTVGGRLQTGEGATRLASEAFGKHAGVSSSVQALDGAETVDSSQGTPTECSPVEVFDGEEEVFQRIKSVKPEVSEQHERRARSVRSGRLARLAGSTPGKEDTRPHNERPNPVPVIGRRVRVFWDGERAWYEGVIDHVDEKNGLMYVVYDDGDESWESYGADSTSVWSYVETKGQTDDVADAVGGHEVIPASSKPVPHGALVDMAAGTKTVKDGTTVNTMEKTFSEVTKTVKDEAGPVKRKRKSLAGVDETVRARIGSTPMTKAPTQRASKMVERTNHVVAAGDPDRPRHTQAPVEKTPEGTGKGSPRVGTVPDPPVKRNRRLQSLIGGHRRTSGLASPQPGNVTNHMRRAMDRAKDTPDSAQGVNGVSTKKGPVSRTAVPRGIAKKPPMSTATAATAVAAAPDVAPSIAPGDAPAPITKPITKQPATSPKATANNRPRKKPITLGDMHDLSSNPKDDEKYLFNNENDVPFSARDAGDDADIFALDALNEAILKAVDSQSTLANKISHQKLSLLKLEMKHALEEAHNRAKNKLSEVTHTSRVNCTNAINTLNSKISEMELFMQQQQVTFDSMQRQCQTLRETAEHTIESSEKKIQSMHDAEMGSLQKLHGVLYESYNEGVAYIKDYAQRMTVVAGGRLANRGAKMGIV